MKKNKIFLKMAALAVMGTMMSGCAEEIEALQTANQTVIQKITISLADDAGTRGAITIDTDSKKGITTFSEGDMIAVIYQNTNGTTVKAVSAALTATDLISEGATATFTVELNSPLAEGAVRYIYPASMAAAENLIDPNEAPGATSIDETPLATQDGTLGTIARNLGLAFYDGTMSATATLPTGTDVKLENQLAIGKFTIKNGSGDDITSTITSLSINDGYNTYTVTTTTQLSTFYVAMLPITSTQTVILNATDGTNHYTKSVTNNPLEASNIYDITVNTTPGANLSLVTANYTALNDEVLSGTLGSNVKVSIADGATVTLNGVTINGVDNSSYNWAGITCEGDATIILADGTTNTVRGFRDTYPGIFVTSGKKLIIKGNGSLDASSGGIYFGAGIGSGKDINCGNIEIQGGNITATGGMFCAGIGCGFKSVCGNIEIQGGTIIARGGDEGAGIGGDASGTCGNVTISGGNITAIGGNDAAGIGAGNKGKCGNISISGGIITATGGERGAGIGGGNQPDGKCGDITITSGVTKVEATRGYYAYRSIGEGYHRIGGSDLENCGLVTVDGVASWAGTSTTNLTCTTSADEKTWTLSHGAANVVAGDLGKVIGADGNIYTTVAQASAAGTTAEAMIAYVGSASNCTHGLAIAFESAPLCLWDELNSKLSTFAASHPVNNGVWRVPSVTDLRYIFAACGGAPVSTTIVDVGHPQQATYGEEYSPGKLVSMASNLGYVLQVVIWTSTPKNDDYSWNYWLIDDDLGYFTSQYTKIDGDDVNRYDFLPILAF